MGHPSAAVLVEAVAAFLAELAPELSGRSAFHAKVAANALAIVARELEQQPDVAEAAALGALTETSAPVAELRREVCDKLRNGSLDAATPGVLDALITATCARLAVDNPRYSTYRRLTEGG